MPSESLMIEREFWALLVRHLKGIIAAIVKYKVDQSTPTHDVKVEWQDAPDEEIFEEG